MAGRNEQPKEIAAFLDGNPSAVAGIRSAVDRAVHRFRFPNPELHDELVQDALARVIVNLNAGYFRGESSLKTYARNVAKYTCLEHLRHKRREAGTVPDSLGSTAREADPENSLIRQEERRRNLRALAELPRECQELFYLVFVEELSYRQVAAHLGVSEGTIKSRVHRCRLTGRGTAEPTHKTSLAGNSRAGERGDLREDK